MSTSTAGRAEDPSGKGNDPSWVVTPSPVEAQLRRWAKQHAHVCSLDSVRGFAGFETFAITLDAQTAQHDDLPALLLIQPHGHEPAQTIGCLDVLGQLLDGRALDGTPAAAAAADVLERFVVVAAPLGNPHGRSRHPTVCFTEAYDYWTSCYISNGKLVGQEGKWPPKPIFKTSEVEIEETYGPGLRHEQIDAETWVDPWSYVGSLDQNPTSFAKLIRRQFDQRRVMAVLDLHQNPQFDTVEAWVPDLPCEPGRSLTVELANAIESRWISEGYHRGHPHPYEPRGLPRAIHEDPRQNHPAVVTIETGGGCGYRNALMTPDVQRSAGRSAIWAAFDYLIAVV